MPDKEVRKLAAIMFTDIEGYTAFVQKDETAALKKVSTHRQYLEQFTADYNGRIIEFYGDGSLSIYESAIDAVHCGIAMQKAYRDGHPIPVRIGIHVGDIVFKDKTVFGDGVNIASRLQTSGIPGSVFISGRVQAELANHPKIKTKSIGFKKLKNVAAPVEVFVVTNEGLSVPSAMSKIPDPKKFVRYLPLIVLGIAWWIFDHSFHDKIFGNGFKAESISVPLLRNDTGDSTLNHIGQMGAHWITKELSASPDALVVSYEYASEMIQMAGVNISSDPGRSKYASLTGAVNIVEAAYAKIGAKGDSLMMSGWIKNLESGDIIRSLEEVKCSSTNPMDCIEALASNVIGYWASRKDKPLTPPNYEAYKAYLAARSAWRSQDDEFVMEQLNKAIALDSKFIDPYFFMLDFFYNEKKPEAAFDTLQIIRKKFRETLDARQTNMLNYHEADIYGRNNEAYEYFLSEYKVDPKDMFNNTSAMVMAIMYRHQPREVLRFFEDIPFDSLPIEGCIYCADRLGIAIWAALDLDSMSYADRLAPKLSNVLLTRVNYGILINYYVWKNDTTKINDLIFAASQHPNLDRKWQYLPYLAGRLYRLRNNPGMSSYYAQKAIEAYLPLQGWFLGKSYYLNNQLDKAIAVFKTERSKHPDDVVLAAEMGVIYARQGNKEQALKLIAELEAMRKPHDYGATEYYQGRIYWVLGEGVKATDLIGKSIAKGMKYDLWITFDHDPDLMGLKDYPGYKQILESFN